ncbi:hypothetical protein [Pseudonocardia endophytica]|uniref:hypothetical protein n=1 Tax=Pseudonocardia endophytica TaxID=401976 RepID=UPI00105141A9|nr:hypothetical protein [Pseudonocardia endophytica]
MDGPGFHVEPDVLDEAARGMAEVVAEQDGAGLDALAGPPERYGHDAVHATMAEFCGAWTIGIDALCDRARRNGTSLSEVATAYRDADAHVARALTGDPGAPVVEPEMPAPR